MKVTVDIVIFTIQSDELKVLLVKRGIPPFKGQFALPGGFVHEDESLDNAAMRTTDRCDLPPFGLDACQAANNRADSIINSGVYQLADTFAKNFRADNGSSTENIFVVKFIAADQLGLNFVMRALHYNQYTPSPWNGFATSWNTPQSAFSCFLKSSA